MSRNDLSSHWNSTSDPSGHHFAVLAKLEGNDSSRGRWWVEHSLGGWLVSNCGGVEVGCESVSSSIEDEFVGCRLTGAATTNLSLLAVVALVLCSELSLTVKGDDDKFIYAVKLSSV